MSIERAGERALVAGSIERALAKAGRRGLSRAEIAERAEKTGDREQYHAALADLERSGVAVEWNSRWYTLGATEWLVGELQGLSGGDALLRSGAGGEAGYFIARRYLNGARSGDRVVAKPLRGGRRRGQQRLPEAGVVKVIQRAFDRLIGTLERHRDRWRLEPFDRRLRAEVEVEVESAKVPEGAYVSVAVDHDASAQFGPLRGRLEHVFGKLEDPGVDAEVVIAHFDLPTEFPEEVLRTAGAFPRDPDESDFAGRRDERDRIVVTIDGATAQDFDDAIHVAKRTDGSFELNVYIADVAHYVTPGSALDLEAYRRGNSVYFADRVLPMLPEDLSNGLCSLRPGVPRLVQAARLEIGGDGVIGGREFFDAVIESRRRLTYLEVERLRGGGTGEQRKEYGEVLPMLEDARELAAVLGKARAARGSIDFDLPTGHLELDESGAPVSVQPSPRTFAHRMIEEFMLAANEAVARELAGQDEPALYRVHEAPKPQRLEELREILKTLGYRLPGELQSLHPSALQAALTAFYDKPEEPFVSALVLRSMQRARYSEENLGHYALSERHYTHFTSPIRRYPDLIVHRKLRRLREEGALEVGERETRRLRAIAEQTSDTERRAERAERELRRWRLVRLLEGRVGETLWGRVTGVEPFGLFIELEEYFVDGLIAVRDMEDDFYEYEPAGHKLIGSRGGAVFRLGDRVEVRISQVDVKRRMIDLALGGAPERRQRRKPQRRRR